MDLSRYIDRCDISSMNENSEDKSGTDANGKCDDIRLNKEDDVSPRKYPLQEDSNNEDAGGPSDCKKSGLGNGISGIIDARDLIEQELETLKGDNIGDTAYSSIWMLNTLSSLCKICEDGWTQSLDVDLCLLWDLSIDKDVRSFLLHHDFLHLVECVLMTQKEPRLIEILVGIIANLCCDEKAVNLVSINANLVTIILNYLLSDDTRILIQIIRLLHVVVCKIWWNEQSNWIAHLQKCEFFAESINHMLRYSTDGDLLMEAITFLRTIFDIDSSMHIIFLVQIFEMDILIPTLLESFVEIVSMEDKERIPEKQLKFTENWLDIMDNVETQELVKFLNKDNENLTKLMNIMNRILEPYKTDYICPVESRDGSIIQRSVNIICSFHYFDINIPSNINHILAHLAVNLDEAVLDTDTETMDLNAEHMDAEREDSDGEVTELSTFINTYWLKIISLSAIEQITEVFCPLKAKACKYLTNLTKQHPDLTCEVLEKIRSILIVLVES